MSADNYIGLKKYTESLQMWNSIQDPPQDLKQEIMQKLSTFYRVIHFSVKLNTVEWIFFMTNCSKWTGSR